MCLFSGAPLGAPAIVRAGQPWRVARQWAKQQAKKFRSSQRFLGLEALPTQRVPQAGKRPRVTR
eukprot:8547552-Alexandrium_andersonii.AAC.1